MIKLRHSRHKNRAISHAFYYYLFIESRVASASIFFIVCVLIVNTHANCSNCIYIWRVSTFVSSVPMEKCLRLWLIWLPPSAFVFIIISVVVVASSGLNSLFLELRIDRHSFATTSHQCKRILLHIQLRHFHERMRWREEKRGDVRTNGTRSISLS